MVYLRLSTGRGGNREKKSGGEQEGGKFGVDSVGGACGESRFNGKVSRTVST